MREKGKYSVTEYIQIVPKELKMAELTQQFEDSLKKVNEGSISKEDFLQELLADIQKEIDMLRNEPIPDEKKIGYSKENNMLGKCPKCGSDVVKGKFGVYCKNKCGMNVSRAMGAVLTDAQVKSLLDGKKILIKGLKGKKGSYDAYLIQEGIEDYSYTKDGKEVKCSQYKFKMEFSKKKK